MAKITIGLPHQGKVATELLVSTLRMLQAPLGHSFGLSPLALSPIDNCRNHIVNDFLDRGDDYLLFIDSDNPPVKNPLELVELDKDIMILPTLMANPDKNYKHMGKMPLIWNVFGDYSEERNLWPSWTHDMVGLQEIGAGGTGCVIIARRVFEAISPAFMRSWDANGTVDQGSDLLFCKWAKDAGFSVWTHFDYKCHHFKTVDLLDMYESMCARDISFASADDINSADDWNKRWEVRPDREMVTYPVIVNTIKQSMNGTSPYRVLDYGCGRGELLSHITKLDGVDATGTDISSVAIDKCKGKGLQGFVLDDAWITDRYDMIVLSQVLEHIDDDRDLLNQLLPYTDRLIYSVPWNCLPPGIEPEHRRIYTKEYVRRITPDLIEIIDTCDDYLIVVAGKQ